MHKIQSQVGRSGVDRVSSSDARGPGFEPWPLQKIPLLNPETLEVPIRGRVQLRILELGDGAREKPKKKKVQIFVHVCSHIAIEADQAK